MEAENWKTESSNENENKNVDEFGKIGFARKTGKRKSKNKVIKRRGSSFELENLKFEFEM